MMLLWPENNQPKLVHLYINTQEGLNSGINLSSHPCIPYILYLSNRNSCYGEDYLPECRLHYLHTARWRHIRLGPSEHLTQKANMMGNNGKATDCSRWMRTCKICSLLSSKNANKSIPACTGQDAQSWQSVCSDWDTWRKHVQTQKQCKNFSDRVQTHCVPPLRQQR